MTLSSPSQPRAPAASKEQKLGTHEGKGFGTQFKDTPRCMLDLRPGPLLPLLPGDGWVRSLFIIYIMIQLWLRVLRDSFQHWIPTRLRFAKLLRQWISIIRYCRIVRLSIHISEVRHLESCPAFCHFLYNAALHRAQLPAYLQCSGSLQHRIQSGLADENGHRVDFAECGTTVNAPHLSFVFATSSQRGCSA